MLLDLVKYYGGCLMIAGLLLFSCESIGQTIPDDNTIAIIRSNYLYQFANNNDWPAERKKGPFVVGIVGNSDVYEIMVAKYASKPIGSQLLSVAGASELQSLPQVHVLFIDRSKKAEFGKYVKEFKSRNTLIVTNWEGALSQGAHINFLSMDGSIRFELNRTAMQESAIKPGVKILQWAIQ